MTEELRPQVQNMIENFNSDLIEAAIDGINMFEVVAIAGAISETVLRIVTPSERLVCWRAIAKIMNRKFDEGEL